MHGKSSHTALLLLERRTLWGPGPKLHAEIGLETACMSENSVPWTQEEEATLVSGHHGHL